MEMGGRRIPADVMVEILKRLPVKSLMRFKSTSKGWCALIKSPHFIKSHLRFSPKSNNGDGFLFSIHERGNPVDDDDDDEEEEEEEEYPPQFSPRRVIHTRLMMFSDDDDESLNGLPIKLNTDYLDSVVDFSDISTMSCCDGILCLSAYCQIPPIPITLWNPATREYKSLPNSTRYTSSASAPEDEDEEENADKFYTVWEVAFGFDTKNDDYKVVAFISVWERMDFQTPNKYVVGYTEVYSLKSNSWRVIDPVIPLNSPNSAYISTLNAHGFYHRVVSLNNHGSNALLSLDMEDEVYRVTPGPPSQCINPCHPYNVTLATTSNSGSNIVAMYYYNCGAIEVWALNDLQFGVGEGVDDCWTLKYMVEPPAGSPPVYQMWLRPLRLWKSCLLLVQSEDFSNGAFHNEADELVALCLHNPCTKITKSILQFPVNYPPLDTYGYMETLVSFT